MSSDGSPSALVLFMVTLALFGGLYVGYSAYRDTIDRSIKAGVLVHGDRAYAILPLPGR